MNEEQFVIGPLHASFQIGSLQEEWLSRLEKYPEKQHKGSLGYQVGSSYKACCLGEAAMCLGVAKFDSAGMMFNQESSAYLWDYELLGLYSKEGMSRYSNTSLSKLNDADKTWPEIAKIVRDNPSNFFKESK